jgi:hypothetical protein
MNEAVESTDSTAFVVLGTCAIPKPRARDFASGLHYPLALALTLTRPFRKTRKGKCLEKLPPVAAAIELKRDQLG